jgi:hypothetical protein
MANSTDFIATVYDTLTRLLNAGELSPSFVMQMAWPGYSVAPADFKAPDAPGGPYDADVARETFSQIANIAPTLNKTYFENSGFEVDDLYEILVSSAIPVGATETAATNPLHRLFSDAQFELMQARRGFKNDPGRFYYPCAATPAQWYDEAAAPSFTAVEIRSADVKPAGPASPFVIAGGLNLVDKGIIKLKPDVNEQLLKTALVQTIDTRNTLLKRQFSPLAAAAPSKPLDAQIRMATRASTGRSVLPTNRVSPTAVSRDSLSEARLSTALKTTSAPVNTFLRPELQSMVQAIRLNPQTLTIESPVRLGVDRQLLIKDLLNQRLPTKPVSPATNGLSISFKFCRVNIDRPWFKLALLAMPNWFMFNTNARAYSTGSIDDNPGMFPLLPLSLVAIRDLRITANWSPEDRANLSNAVSFGFFDLRNGQFSQNTYEVKGLQIIAWISRLTPPLPPAQT